MDIKRFTEYREKVVSSVSRAIVGKERQIELVLNAFVCSGHVLLEDVPGTGKTMLLRAFAKSMGGAFRRVQFTPDLLPSDLTGINFFSQKTGKFEFRKGPLFADVVLADEINRATPRTQSALLEAMEERQISVDGDTYPLGEDFIVMATQNPLESYGTFPLPEAPGRPLLHEAFPGVYDPAAGDAGAHPAGHHGHHRGNSARGHPGGDPLCGKTHFREVEVGTDVRNYLMDLGGRPARNLSLFPAFLPGAHWRCTRPVR